MPLAFEHSINNPSTIIWTQTLESITLQIRINHVRVLISEKCLKLSCTSNTISLPLFDRLYVSQYDIDLMMTANNNSNTVNNIIIITLEKECCDIWPHLLLQQADDEMEAHLIEANFLVHINQQQQEEEFNTVNTNTSLYDTLDFETVISGQGEKTGLE